MPELDAVIIGAGHNGLTCAAYLGMAGLSVRVLERRNVVGGAAVTEEFHPGFRNSTAAYTVSLLQAKVIGDLKLHEHGLRIVERRAQNFLPLPDGRYLLTAEGRTEREIAKFSAKDAARYPAYQAEISRVAGVLRSLVLKAPPNLILSNLGYTAREIGQLAAIGRQLFVQQPAAIVGTSPVGQVGGVVVHVIVRASLGIVVGAVLRLIHRTFERDGAVDLRLTDEFQETETQDPRQKADQHPAGEQHSDHDVKPAI